MLQLGDRDFALPRGGAARDVEALTLRMDEIEVAVHASVTPAADVDVRPVETVSRSEGGFERTPQQLAVLCSWPVRLGPGEEFRAAIRVRLASDGAE